MNRVFLPFGSNPSQDILPQFKTTNEMLLYAAWVHGMVATSMIYRRTIFHYVQTHLSPKTQQSLQKTIDTSEYFESERFDKGWYCLNNRGLAKINELYGQTKEDLPRNWDYEFFTQIGKHELSIYSSVSNQEYVFRLNTTVLSASEIIRRLINEGLYETSSSSQASILLFDFLLRSRFNWRIIGFPILSEIEISDAVKDEDELQTFSEGRVYYELHRKKERSSDLVKTAKSIWKKNDPLLRCQVCHFSFKEQYGDIGEGYIEAHHVIPVSELKEETEQRVEDLIMVCSNCHKMLHAKRPWPTHNEIVGRLRQKWNSHQ